MAYTLSFVESPIICCTNFAAFAAHRLYLHVQDRSCIPAVTSVLQVNGRQNRALMVYRVLGEPYTAKESPRSLAIWGLGSPYH